MSLRDDVHNNAACADALARKDCQELAKIMSIGRKRLQSKRIGVGTIIAVFGSVGLSGGEFLDALVTAGQTNRDVHWAMVLIQNSNFDIGDAAAQYQMTQLSALMPVYAPGLNVLKTLGFEPFPYSVAEISQAVFNDDGTEK